MNKSLLCILLLTTACGDDLMKIGSINTDDESMSEDENIDSTHQMAPIPTRTIRYQNTHLVFGHWLVQAPLHL